MDLSTFPTNSKKCMSWVPYLFDLFDVVDLRFVLIVKRKTDKRYKQINIMSGPKLKTMPADGQR